jgi:hypothetical protein
MKNGINHRVRLESVDGTFKISEWPSNERLKKEKINTDELHGQR